MSYLDHLIRFDYPVDTRWIIKTKPNGTIREVKQIYSPEEYSNNKRTRVLHDQGTVIEILKKERSNK